MTYTRFTVLAVVAAAAIAHAGTALALRDGKRFDPAASMTARAEGASEQIDQVAWMVGHWDVELTRYLDGDSSYATSGRADITFMNRGHHLMERFHCADFDGQGNELSTLAFLMFSKNLGSWGLGVADSWREDITVYNGGFDGDDLVLTDVRRPKGGLALTYYRLRIHRDGDDAFVTALSASTDGVEFADAVTRSYSRRVSDDGLFTSAEGYGEAAPNLPEESRQFDFLIGEWGLENDLTFANGRNAKWTATGTAVYMMNGHCVMEFTWFDTDPNLPDAATTIVRLWNRQMRRWECMYANNRFNSILHFGGVREGDRIVLHLFDADASDTPISQWTFHSWKPGSYGWYANTSRDRGATWAKTWIIEGTRKE